MKKLVFFAACVALFTVALAPAVQAAPETYVVADRMTTTAFAWTNQSAYAAQIDQVKTYAADTDVTNTFTINVKNVQDVGSTTVVNSAVSYRITAFSGVVGTGNYFPTNALIVPAGGTFLLTPSITTTTNDVMILRRLLK